MVAQSTLKDSETLRRLARDEVSKYVLTEHAKHKMRALGISLAEIQGALRNAAIVSDAERDIDSRSRWRVRGKMSDGDDIELVVSVSEGDKTVHLFTLHVADALEELADSAPSKHAVERRVDDWSMRIEALYDLIKSWLPAGWGTERSGAMQMQEELMQKYDLAPRKLPKLDILREGNLAGSIEPRGLWIIGANGRLDLALERRSYVIVDLSKPFEVPQWHIAPLAHREKLQPLEHEAFLGLLSNA